MKQSFRWSSFDWDSRFNVWKALIELWITKSTGEEQLETLRKERWNIRGDTSLPVRWRSSAMTCTSAVRKFGTKSCLDFYVQPRTNSRNLSEFEIFAPLGYVTVSCDQSFVEFLAGHAPPLVKVPIHNP